MGDSSESDADSGTDAHNRIKFSKANKNYKVGDNLDELRKNGSLARMIQGAPEYNSKDPVMWRRNMLSYASSYFDLHDILEGTEKRPKRAPGELKNHYLVRDSYWLERINATHKMVSSSVIRATASDKSTTSRIYVDLVDSISGDDPKRLWDELKLLNDEHGKAEKTLAVLNWVKNENRDNKMKLDEYSTKQTEYLQRVEQLGTTLREVNAILFLNGLPPVYHKVIQSFMDKPSFTQDQVFRQAHIYDSTKSSMKSVGLVTETARHAVGDDEEGYFANDRRGRENGKNAKGRGQGNKRGKEQGGNYGGGKKGKYGNHKEQRGPPKRDFKGKEYVHDWKQHPNDATAWEKNLTCKGCSKKGHTRRTCPKSKKKTKKAENQEEQADLADEYPQYDQQWHEENDNYSDDYDSDSNVSNVHMSSSSSSSSSLPSSNYVIESSSRYLYHPKWQAPLGYLLYLQLYKSLFSGEIICEDIAYMTEENDEPKSAKRQTTVNSLLARSIRILRFIVDSGASRHMANITPDVFENFSHHSSDSDIVRIRTAGRTVIQSIGEGDFGPMQKILSVPELSANLFSVRSCCLNGYKVLFSQDKCEIFESPDIVTVCCPVMTAYPDGKSWVLEVVSNDHDAQDTRDIAFLADTKAMNKYERAHNRLPHPSSRTMQYMKHSKNWTNFGDWTKDEQTRCSHSLCKGCAQGKQHMAPVSRKPRRNPLATQPGQLFFMDLFYSNIPSDNDRKWCLLFVDAHSRMLWSKFLTHKHEATDKIKEWVADREKEGILLKQWAELPKKKIKSDPGTEFSNSVLAQFFIDKKITQELTPAKEHCHMVERQIQTVKEGTAAYLQAAKVELTRAASVLNISKKSNPYIFWAEAVAYTIFCLNKMPATQQAPKSRNQFWDQSITSEDMSRLKVFGCRVSIKSYESLKPGQGGVAQTKVSQEETGQRTFPTWHSKSYDGIFMGVDEKYDNNYRIFSLKTKRYIVTNNVVFNENLEQEIQSSKLTRDSLLTIIQLKAFLNLSQDQTLALDQVIYDNRHILYDDWTPLDDESTLPHPMDTLLDPVQRGKMKWDYKQLKASVFAHVDAERAHSAMESDEFDPVISERRRNDIMDFAYKAHEERIPVTYHEATQLSVDKELWQQASDLETQSFVEKDALRVMLRSEVPEGHKVLGTKWVYDIKSSGRFKARYTVKGCQQRKGFDFDETFSPVVRYSTLRTLCAIAAGRDYHLHQMDVETAFLYGRLSSEDPPVFFELPENYPIPEEYKDLDPKLLVAQANSAVYGLKQASRKFYQTFCNHMTERLGFIRSTSDECLFYKQDEKGNDIWVAVFVDDLIIASPSADTIKNFKDDMRKQFSMKDLGESKEVLGITITRDRTKGTITLAQERYILQVLTRFNITPTDRRKHSLPMSPHTIDKLSLADCPQTTEDREEADLFPYREVVGSLMYLMVSTRPDIAFAVGQLAKFMSNWGLRHIQAAKDLLLYLNGTTTVGITYGNGPQTLSCFVDANWSYNPDNGRSTTGYVFFLFGGPISWRSKEQETVALSSTEAEYMALSYASQEAIHLRMLLPFMHVDVSMPTIIYEDNQSALYLANNPLHKERTKHINIRYHFVRERIQSLEIVVEKVDTKFNVADLFTKPVDNTTFYRLLDKLLGNKE